MRKLLLLMALICTIGVKVQFAGGFGCGDANAWFDKEIYFYSQNQASNRYVYGLKLSNISLVIDGKWQVDVSGV